MSRQPLPFNRRELLQRAAAGLLAVAAVPRLSGAQTPAATRTQKPQLIVFKDAGCQCCQGWVQHMQQNGFAASVTNTTNMAAVRQEHRIPTKLQSCHTTLVGGYVVEGHVPAADVKKLLADKPKGIRGLTIPGMPASAPGMDVKPFEPYTVLTFDDAGKTSVYAKHDKA